MRSLIYSVLFLLFPAFSFSQYSVLKKDKNISWIAEFEMELSFDLNRQGDHVNSLTLKKFTLTEDAPPVAQRKLAARVFVRRPYIGKGIGL